MGQAGPCSATPAGARLLRIDGLAMIGARRLTSRSFARTCWSLRGAPAAQYSRPPACRASLFGVAMADDNQSRVSGMESEGGYRASDAWRCNVYICAFTFRVHGVVEVVAGWCWRRVAAGRGHGLGSPASSLVAYRCNSTTLPPGGDGAVHSWRNAPHHHTVGRWESEKSGAPKG